MTPARRLVLSFLVAVSAPLGAPADAPAQAAEDGAQLAGEVRHVLRPGDVVKLRIWREPDLSGDFPVDEDGIVVFPKIGSRRVTHWSPDELKRELVRSYQRYLVNPSIDVVFLRRINVLGAVRSAGLYTVDPTMTLADVLAMAGGTMPDGDPHEVRLIRGGDVITARVDHDARIGDLPIRSGDQIYVPERHWVTRHSGLIATAISAGVSLIIAVFIR